ncbi:hypothetical protein HK104_008708 [Borealophlyctis nickersoniae]|nr:hypothetical protein HK104_008708 [Borealophlyctis nickersoniae]
MNLPVVSTEPGGLSPEVQTASEDVDPLGEVWRSQSIALVEDDPQKPVERSDECAEEGEEMVSSDLKRLSYIEQLENIISVVMAEEMHLLDEDDRTIIATYRNLPECAKELYFKLLNHRTLKFERVDKLNYPSISDLNGGLDALCYAKPFRFTDESGPPDLMGWLGLLRRDELDELAKGRHICTAGKSVNDVRELLVRSTKSQTILSFLSASSQRMQSSRSNNVEDNLKTQVRRKLGKVIRLSDVPRDTFHRIFVISNRTREWPEDDKFMTNSILTNLREGARRFPSYTVNRTSLIWPTRDACIDYVRYLKMERHIRLILQNNTVADFQEVVRLWKELKVEWDACVMEKRGHVTQIPWFQVFTPGWILTRIMDTCAGALFRLKDYEQQVQLLRELVGQRLFCPARRGSWYDDLVRILDNYIDKREAARVCFLALEDPFVRTGHRSSIQKRLRRLYKGKMKPETVDFGKPEKLVEYKIQGIKTFSQANQKALWQGEGGENVHVEELALQYYRRKGWKGLHAENSIVTTLFGLLFWDILFDDTVPAVFSSPHQVAPLDLHTEFFYEGRREAIESRLLQISEGGFVEILADVDDRERPLGTLCAGVRWNNFTKEHIIEIAECIGGPALSRICRLFAKTYWAHSGGVPDLCIWKHKTKEFRLVEVKGQGDRLSDKQVVWLEHLMSFGVDAITLHVAMPKLAGLVGGNPGVALKKRKTIP